MLKTPIQMVLFKDLMKFVGEIRGCFRINQAGLAILVEMANSPLGVCVRAGGGKGCQSLS